MTPTIPGLRRAVTEPSSDDPVVTGPQDRSRRELFLQASAAALALSLPGTASTAWADDAPALPAEGAPFLGHTVPDLARELAKRPYAAPRTDDLPGALTGLNREQYNAIRTVPGSAIWANEAFGFTLEPLHRGSVFTGRVALALVEDGTVRPLAYDRARFEAEGIALPEFKDDPGYSGLRIRARFDGGELTDFATFQGASFFRLVATGQGFGVTARALTLRPADSRGEEFPELRAIWVERPGPGGPLVLHCLVDSPSATASLRMSLRPGGDSLCDVEGTVFARAAIDHLGLGGMTTSYLFGPYDRRGADDARAGAYASTGLQIRTGANEAIWRPARNPETLQVSSFVDENPKGFGPDAAGAQLRRFRGRRAALGVAPVALARAVRQLGAGRGDAPRNPERFRVQRKHPGLLAAEGDAGGGHRACVQLSPALVLAAAGGAARGARLRHPQRQGAGEQPPPLPGGFHR